MRHLYARSVRLADDWVGRLLTRLDDAGLLDDTLVLVTSDHGENFGEDGLMAHAFSLDDRLINVPFVSSHDLSAPGPLSLADVPALLAGELGIEDHPWRERACPPGLAAAQWDFVAEDDPRVEVASEAWDLTAEQRAKLSTPLTSVTDGAAKLMAVGDRHEGEPALEPGLASAGPVGDPRPQARARARVRHRGHRAADEAARLHVAMVDRSFGEERAAERDIDLGGRSLREHTARGALINAAFFTGLAAISLGRRFGVAIFLDRRRLRPVGAHLRRGGHGAVAEGRGDRRTSSSSRTRTTRRSRSTRRSR